MKTNCIFVAIMLLACSLAFATDPWGTPEVLTGSMTVMSQVSINGEPAVTGDVVAAFVSVGGVPILRGKATVMVVGAVAGCFIQIYTETNGDTVSLKVWDDSAGIAYDVSQTLVTEINGIVGTYPDNLYQISAGQVMVPDPWPAPIILPGSMTVMAQVAIDSVAATTGDILAAIVTVGGEDQLRGRGNIIVNNGIAGCLLQVFSEANGETVSFKVWDYSAQQMFTASQTVLSVVDGVIGSWPDNLFQINATNAVQQVMALTFDPTPGLYITPQNISISCATPNATIRYTTDGTIPTETSALYSTPISCPLNSTTTFKARGFMPNWEPSFVSTAQYTITGTVQTPLLSPNGGTYQNVQDVVLTCTTSGATIRYTTNNAVPTETSTIYTTPIVCQLNNTTTIKTRAYKADWAPSQMATATYVITGTVATPAFSPEAGTYYEPQTVSITCTTPGALIHYTTNGSIPTATSPLYTVPITISASTTLRAKAFKTNWTTSDLATAAYNITGFVAAPTFNPPPGDYEEAIDVVMSCSTPSAQIRYTTDGSEPNETSELYHTPLHIEQDITIKAIALLADWMPSATVTAEYNVSVAIDDPNAVPISTGIYRVYPNPFSANATIRIGFKDANSKYNLNIYNIRGELVHRSSGHANGYLDYNWNGCDNRGKRLPSGVYLISLKSGGTHKTRKIVLK